MGELYEDGYQYCSSYSKNKSYKQRGGPRKKSMKHSEGMSSAVSVLIVISLIVVALKLGSNQSVNLLQLSPAFPNMDMVSSTIRAVPTYIFGYLHRYNWCLVPLLASLTATLLAWGIIYVDSNHPGRDPPTPFSPAVYRRRSGHTLHLQYGVTLTLGIIMMSHMLYNRWPPLV